MDTYLEDLKLASSGIIARLIDSALDFPASASPHGG